MEVLYMLTYHSEKSDKLGKKIHNRICHYDYKCDLIKSPSTARPQIKSQQQNLQSAVMCIRTKKEAFYSINNRSYQQDVDYSLFAY